MTHQVLEVAILPNGSLLLELAEAAEEVVEASVQAQQELFRRYHREPETWLLLLGFADKGLGFSPSLEYWRSFAGRFIAALGRIPELEELRGRAVVEPLAEEEAEELLVSAPLMIGVEYLNRELLDQLWQQLKRAFRILIEGYEGTVEAFFKAHSPALQLAGRVFFHLV